MRVKTGSEQSNLFDILGHAERMASRKSGLDRLRVIDWEGFRPVLMEHLAYEDQSKGGRPPWCPVLMLKVLFLQRFHDLSDEQMEYQLADRFSFLRFVGLRPGDSVPDHATIWAFKERLGEEGIVAVFEAFDCQLRAKGLIGHEGKIVDASFVEAPRQRNRPDENRQIKEGRRPKSFEKKPRRSCQKDSDARWTKKNGQSYYGYKNHAKVDAASKFVEAFVVTHAAVHDSQVLADLIGEEDREAGLWADSAYVGEAIDRHLKGHGVHNFVCEKGTRGRKLTREQKKLNRTKSSVRSRVEHVFGRITHFGGDRFRRIGIRRARFEICLTNLTYNFDRYAFFRT